MMNERKTFNRSKPGNSSDRHSLLHRFLREKRGISVVEFALVLPIFVTLGMYGTEIAYMSTVNMQVSQIALSVADNASRLGQTDNSAVTPVVTEADVDSVMFGAMTQAEGMDLEQNGRIILSSLERDAFTGKQFIHWQRCQGGLTKTSVYGNDAEKNGLHDTTITSVGNAGSPITAETDSPVMVAEVYYRYHGLFGDMFTKDQIFRQEAIMTVRDKRNLQNIYATPPQDGLTGDPSASVCT